MKINYKTLNGFAIEAKLLGISPLVEEPEYKKFDVAHNAAFELKSSGKFIDFISMFFPGWVIKYHPSLDYHHGIDALLVSPEGKEVSVDISTYPKPKQELKAMVNIVDSHPIGFWKQLIQQAVK